HRGGAAAAACDASGRLLRLIRRDLETCAGLRWRAGRGDVGQCAIRLDVDAAMAAQSYRLDVGRRADGSASVVIVGGGADGLRYGVQTFRQLVRHSGPAVPVVHIEDAPVLPVRGYYLDVTRGRMPTLASLKALVDTLELHKYNQLQLYVEHTFRFDGLGQAWRGTGALGADDILELDEYCAKAGIELVPSVSTFGHQYMALRTDRYAGLGEFPEQAGRPFSLIERMEHHTLNLLMGESLALAKRLIDQYAPLFRSRRFNICADETFDLGKGRSAAQAGAVGVGTLYAGYLTELCSYLEERGLQPMMWADIAVGHPQALERLRDKAILLNWQYEPDVDESRTALVASTGAVQYVCPAVHCWNALLPRIDTAWNNISRMAAYGAAHRAEGILVTDWGDYGHVNDPVMSLPGLCYGAQCGWNGGGDCGQAAVDRAIDRLEYGVEGGFVDALRRASACTTFGWDDAVRYLELDMHAYDHADHRPVLNGDVAAFCDVCVGPGAAERVAGAADVRQARGRLLKAFAARVGDAGVRDAELMSVRERLGRLLGGMRGDRVRFGGSAMLAIEGVAAMNWAGWHLLRMHGIGCTEVRGVRVPSAEETACRLEEWAEAMADAWRESSRESELRRVTDVAWALADEVRRATKAI
uniref:beta-N-acetylhexosaminidase n=1 Tax=Bifidobacterium pullorum TaxID=78448 RepID=UPI003A91FBDB